MRFSIVDRGDDNSKRVAETLKKKCIDIGWEYDDENLKLFFCWRRWYSIKSNSHLYR